MPERGIHPTSIIHPSTVLGRNVEVGAYSIIEEGCEVGDNTRIESYTLLKKNTKLGKDVWIYSNTIISALPMIYRIGEGRVPAKEDTKFGVVIEDGVAVGSYSVIVKGLSRDTMIKSSGVLGHHCHIGHDAIIGENSVVVTGSVLGGYVELGKKSYIGLSTDVRQRVEIGDYVYIGMGSLVLGDVPDYSFGYGRPMKIIGRTDDIKIKARLMSHNIRRKIRRVFG